MTSHCQQNKRIVFAVTAHGLGHAVRAFLVVKELQKLCPGLEIVISSGLDPKSIARLLPLPVSLRRRHYEPGTVQKNCFELDADATRQHYRAMQEMRHHDLMEETAFLRETGCRGVVSDIPSLPIKAAAVLGLPSVGISNFTWDWVLEPIFSHTPDSGILQQLAEDYASGSLHLRLPFGPATSPFPMSETAGLIARRATTSPGAVKELLGISSQNSRKLVVVCPGGWDPSEWQRIPVDDESRLFFYLLVGNLPIDCTGPHLHLPHELLPGIALPDLINAADAVLAKPGYGIASECLLHRTPVVFIERPDFRETPLLLEQFAKIGRCADLSLRDFFSGCWRQSLEQALLSDAAWQPQAADAAAKAAVRLAAFFGL